MTPEAIVGTTLVLAFSAGAAAIFAAGLTPRLRVTAAELWAFYLSEFLIVAALLVPAALGRIVFALALVAFLARAAIELFRLFGKPGSALAAWIIVALMVAAIDGVRAGISGFLWIFVVFATVEIGDAFALLTGKLIGRRRIFPKLSPRKTAEGLIGGLVLGGAAGCLLALTLLGLPLPAAIPLAVLVLAAGLAGDLAVSALKRAHDVKDLSPVLARHGGILDIYDSFLFAAPAAFAFRLIAGV